MKLLIRLFCLLLISLQCLTLYAQEEPKSDYQGADPLEKYRKQVGKSRSIELDFKAACKKPVFLKGLEKVKYKNKKGQERLVSLAGVKGGCNYLIEYDYNSNSPQSLTRNEDFLERSKVRYDSTFDVMFSVKNANEKDDKSVPLVSEIRYFIALINTKSDEVISYQEYVSPIIKNNKDRQYKTKELIEIQGAYLEYKNFAYYAVYLGLLEDKETKVQKPKTKDKKLGKSKKSTKSKSTDDSSKKEKVKGK